MEKYLCWNPATRVMKNKWSSFEVNDLSELPGSGWSMPHSAALIIPWYDWPKVCQWQLRAGSSNRKQTWVKPWCMLWSSCAAWVGYHDQVFPLPESLRRKGGSYWEFRGFTQTHAEFMAMILSVSISWNQGGVSWRRHNLVIMLITTYTQEACFLYMHM